MRAVAALPETSYRGELPEGKLLFSCWIVSDSLWPHKQQQARLPCTSPCPRVCSNSCPLSWWCYPTISSSVAPFFSCPLSFPASGSFPMSRLFASGGQNIGASASTSVLLMIFRVDLWDQILVWWIRMPSWFWNSLSYISILYDVHRTLFLVLKLREIFRCSRNIFHHQTDCLSHRSVHSID